MGLETPEGRRGGGRRKDQREGGKKEFDEKMDLMGLLRWC